MITGLAVAGIVVIVLGGMVALVIGYGTDRFGESDRDKRGVLTMKMVYKYPVSNYLTHEMPKGAKVLHVHEQNGDICLWALVDVPKPPQNPEWERRKFIALATGDKIPDDWTVEYVGTVHMHGGALVFHVFEITEDRSDG